MFPHFSYNPSPINKTLTNLDLSDNGISDAGATSITEAIKVNKTLTNLELSCNRIIDAGATCIAEGNQSQQDANQFKFVSQ